MLNSLLIDKIRMWFANKKFLIIFGALIALALIYILFFSDKKFSETISPLFQETQAPITPQPESHIFQLSQSPSSNAVLIDNNIYYFNKNTGELLKTSFSQTSPEKTESSKLINGVLKLIGASGKDFIAVQYDESYDLTEKYAMSLNNLNPLNPLNKNIHYIAFSPDGAKIAYQYYNKSTGENNISISSPNGSDFKNIFFLRLKDVALFWPKSDLITILTKPSGLSQGYLYAMNASGKNFTKILGDIYGLSIKFSPDGSKFLYSQTDANGKNLTLNMASIDGKITKTIAVKTAPDKCAWSQNNQTIYCAVPKNLTYSQTMPDDFYKDYRFIDDIYKINLETGEAGQIRPNETNNYQFNAKDLILDPMERYLIFLNKNDLFNYSIEL